MLSLCHNYQPIPTAMYCVLSISSPPVDDHILAAHYSKILVHTSEPAMCHSPDHHNQNTECYLDFQYYTENVPTQHNSTFLWTVERLQEDSAAEDTGFKSVSVLMLLVPSIWQLRTALIWVTTQRVVVISYWYSRTTHRSHPHSSGIQKKACSRKTEFI